MSENLSKTVTLYLNAHNYSTLFSAEAKNRLSRCAKLSLPPSAMKPELDSICATTEILVTGWGSPPLSRKDLERCRNLGMIIHAAGSLRSTYPELDFPQGVRVSSAAHVNARPVAEYTLGLILCSLRGAFSWTDRLRKEGLSSWWELHHNHANGYAQRTIAVVGFGLIARQLIQLLRPFGFEILVVSEFVRPEEEASMRIRKTTLQEAAAKADVLSLHEADQPEFDKMIDATVLAALKDGATLINTARGRLIDEKALHQTLSSRPLLALLDVLENENSDQHLHPLLELSNCYITPHIAGSLRGEVLRFGDYVCDEIESYKTGQALSGAIDLSTLSRRA